MNKHRNRFALLLGVMVSSIFFSAPHNAARADGHKPRADSAWAELTTTMQTMHGEMASARSSGDDDIDFVRLMVPHHQAALGMAKTELLYGKDPEMRRLAQEIVADQQSEIELMNLWLKQHGAESHKKTEGGISNGKGELQ